MQSLYFATHELKDNYFILMGKVELNGEDGTMNIIVLQLQFISLISKEGGVLAKIGMQKYGNNGSRNVSILSAIFNQRTVQFGCGEIVEATLHFRLLKTMNRNILAEWKGQMFKELITIIH
ncbi:unnamed protein product [Paramecium pentaurelia]|uniref:Uncharacterized protein n=1 Tax=Paramecium pentaurelia TaxID=43138 RepID=A0A8S1S5P1_9CILI|nr:unnamed protein product [Paramecium pentaurelia]